MIEQLQNNFKSLRVRSGLTQEETANILGISRMQLMRYEDNPEKVTTGVLLKLAHIYNCEANEFFLKIDVTESYDIANSSEPKGE